MPKPSAARSGGKYRPALVARWVGAYVVLALLPLLLGLVGSFPDARPFAIELAVALGFVGIGMFALQFVISGRFRRVAPVFGTDVVLQFHRQAGIAALLVVLAHPVVLVARDGDNLSFFDPRDNLPRAAALSFAVVAAIVLLVSSLWRVQLRLDYERWRLVHGALATLLLLVGIVHGIQVSHHLDPVWKKVLWIVALGAALWLVVHSRAVRPWLLRRRPYVVTGVHRELRDVCTIRMAPRGHGGMRFRAGQFAWITLGATPFRLQQHPFSFSSSEHDEEIAFTAKAVGDFTSTWPDVPVGSGAYLEGPYGGFTLDASARGAVFMAGGIGVTPIVSMLRTAADEGDQRRFTLFFATSRLERAAFRDDLAELAPRLDLTVHHVLEDPHPAWEGLTGYLGRDILDDHLPAARCELDYFICGPEPMMDACETALRELGISWRRIYTERFQVV